MDFNISFSFLSKKGADKVLQKNRHADKVIYKVTPQKKYFKVELNLELL